MPLMGPCNPYTHKHTALLLLQPAFEVIKTSCFTLLPLSVRTLSPQDNCSPYTNIGFLKVVCGVTYFKNNLTFLEITFVITWTALHHLGRNLSVSRRNFWEIFGENFDKFWMYKNIRGSFVKNVYILLHLDARVFGLFNLKRQNFTYSFRDSLRVNGCIRLYGWLCTILMETYGRPCIWDGRKCPFSLWKFLWQVHGFRWRWISIHVRARVLLRRTTSANGSHGYRVFAFWRLLMPS